MAMRIACGSSKAPATSSCSNVAPASRRMRVGTVGQPVHHAAIIRRAHASADAAADRRCAARREAGRPRCSSGVAFADDVRDRPSAPRCSARSPPARRWCGGGWTAAPCSSRRDRAGSARRCRSRAAPAAAVGCRRRAGSPVRPARSCGVRGSAPRRRGPRVPIMCIALWMAIQCGPPVMSSSRSTACMRTITGSGPLTSPFTSARCSWYSTVLA